MGETYPSGHIVNYGYDSAGRLLSFSGNLGDGVSRTYASAISYDEGGRMLEEQYGMQTALFHKLRYNVRGQLYDVRLSTLSRAQSATDWNRGCLAFYYSVNNQAWGGSGTDNSGNVTKAEIYVPNADGSYNMLQDQYSYDSLNRLQSVNEYQWGTQAAFTQAYTYDRWGNRQINQAASSTNVNRMQFSINTANNRLGVPTGQSGQMFYDASGNLTTDTYSRVDPTRTYDGENRLITNTNTSNQVSRYTYDAAGMRVRRNINNQETWQVYGIGGELIAEYAANASPSSVQKEYGYRGGELLVTATSTASIEWLVDDQLGTPRMIVDKLGTLAGVKRHDYLPFGEEIYAGTGGRTAQQGYAADSVRQKFTKYERDSETNLDFAEARYFSSPQGRFTSVDPISASMRAIDPQSFNRYSYVSNNPVNRIDPNGKDWTSDASQRGFSQSYLNQIEQTRWLGFSSSKNLIDEFEDFPDPYSIANGVYGEQQSKNAQATTSTTPTALQVISITVLPDGWNTGRNGQDGCPPGTYGIKVAITYQVVDKNGKPISRNDMVAQETVTNVKLINPDGKADHNTNKNPVPTASDIGPSRINGTSRQTDANGRFIDAAYGYCWPTGFRSYTFTQKITIVIGNKNYKVRTNKLTITSSGPNKGTITNRSDIQSSR